MTVRIPGHHRRADLIHDPGDRLSGQEIVGEHLSAVRISCHRMPVQQSVERALIHADVGRTAEFLKNINPGIEVGRAVIAVHHRHLRTGGCRDQIKLRIDPAERFLQHDHGEDARPGGDIARSYRHGVRRRHAGPRIALRRTERNACLQRARGIKKRCALRRQHAGRLSGAEALRQNLFQLPREMLRLHQRVKLPDHPPVEIRRLRIDREHAGRIADADDLFPCQLPVHIARQRRKKPDILYVLLSVQNRLPQMRDAPPLRNVITEQLRQFL